MLGLAGLLALVTGATEVSLSVVPGAPCVTQPELVRKLSAAGVRVTEEPGPGALVVKLSGEKRLLVVRARRAELPFERRVPASLEACAAVERVTLALITAWAATPAAEGRDAGVLLVAPGAERLDAGTPASQLGNPEPPVPAQRAVSATSPPHLPPLEPVALPPGATKATPPIPPDLALEDAGPTATPLEPGRFDDPPLVSVELAAADAGVGLLEAAVVEGGAAVSSAPLRLELAVLGGVSGGPTPVATAAGSMLAGLSFGRWGVLLEAGLESERAAVLEAVRVSATLQWLSLSFRVAFDLFGSLTLDLALGARGWRIAARATGVTVARDRDEVTAGPALAAGLSWRVMGPLILHLRPSVALRVQPLSLNVDPVGRVLLLEPWSVGAMLGVLFRFE